MAKHPSLALEIGIGRPDLEGAFDAGLVDVKNAPASVLAGLPGLDEEIANRIEAVRAQIGGFASLEDLAATLDLPGDVVEGLRDQVVFLPRGRS
ncbi:MAG: helix-hairpin-helix domain-containing protein [Actinomycetota bacterium]|nr:helix-hairpin-helix domain-containing protein [Actinomycetota bacterium]